MASWFDWKAFLGLETKDPLPPAPPTGGDWGTPPLGGYGSPAANWPVFGESDRNMRAMVEEGYKKNSAVFACVSTLAFAFPEPPLSVFKRGKAEEVIDEHPIRTLMQRPNPDMGEAELLQHIITYMAIGGSAYLYKVRDRLGQPRELWPYHAGEMWPVSSATQWIDHYVYDRGDGQLRAVPKEDVIHCKWMPDPQRPGRGFAPLKAVARETDSDNEMTRYLYALLRNDAMPRTALTLPKDSHLSDEQFKRLAAQFAMRYGGDRRGSVAVLEGGVEIERLALDLEEMAFDALRGVPEARIAAAFRTPAIVAGLSVGLARSTFANFAEARQSFTEQTLVPLWRSVASEIESSLLADFGDYSISVHFDLRQVEALNENRNDLWKRVLNGVQRGVLQINEARMALGYESITGGDVFSAAPAPAAPAELMDEGTKRLSSLEAKAFGPKLAKLERKIAGDVQQQIAGDYEAVAKMVEGE